MVHDKQSIRSDLIVGAVSGLGLSAALWSLALEPPQLDLPRLALLIGGSMAGLSPARLPRLGRLGLVYPLVLAALMIDGPGLAVLAATICGVVPWAARIAGRQAGSLREAAFDVGSSVSRAGVASLVFFWIASAGGALPVALLGFGATDRILDHMAGLAGDEYTDGQPRVPRHARIDTLRAMVVVVAGGAAAWLLTQALMDATMRPYLAVAPLTQWAHALRGAAIGLSARRNQACREGRSRLRSIARALSRAVSASGGPDQEQAFNVHLHSVALGERMGLTPRQRDALGHASLLVEAGRVAHASSDDEMLARKHQPLAGADLVAGLSFPAPTATFVRHARERWNGLGYPDRLQGEQIPIGARIIAAVSWYHALRVREGNDADSATLSRGLMLEAGERFDPVVVDLLLDHLSDLRAIARHPVDRRESTRQTARADDPRELSGAEYDLRTLYEISRVVGYELPFEERLALIATKLQGRVEFRNLAVFRPAPEGQRLLAGPVFGPDAETLRGRSVAAGVGPTGRAFVERRAVCGQSHAETLGSGRSMRSLSAPLVAGPGACLGTLTVYDEGEQSYPAEERHALVAVAGHLARVLGDEHGAGSLTPVQLTDPLTGLPDARFLSLELSQRVAPVDAAPAPRFGLIALRAVGIADLTQRRGIDSVERTLVELARRLAAAGRADETLTRYGHDLFVVLTPVRQDGELIACWDRMLRSLKQPRPGEEELDLRVVASHAGYPVDGDSVESLLETLESRLRLAVEDGRGVMPFPVAAGSAS